MNAQQTLWSEFGKPGEASLFDDPIVRDEQVESAWRDVLTAAKAGEFDEGATGYDYHNQAWVLNGRYESCAHPRAMRCQCFGRLHTGEALAANANLIGDAQ